MSSPVVAGWHRLFEDAWAIDDVAELRWNHYCLGKIIRCSGDGPRYRLCIAQTPNGIYCVYAVGGGAAERKVGYALVVGCILVEAFDLQWQALSWWRNAASTGFYCCWSTF